MGSDVHVERSFRTQCGWRRASQFPFPLRTEHPFSIGQVVYSVQDTEDEEKQELENAEGEDGRGRAVPGRAWGGVKGPPRPSGWERQVSPTHRCSASPSICMTGAVYKPFRRGPRRLTTDYNPLSWQGRHHDSHFTDEETEAQRGEMICPRSLG